MTKSCIVIANGSTAKLFIVPRSRLLNNDGVELAIIQEFEHPETRQKASDLASDKQGHYECRDSAGHGSFVEPTDPKEHEAEVFAREIAGDLETRRNANEFEDIILVAPPHFNGLLTKTMNQQLSTMISVSVKKDYTKFNGRELLAHLGQHL